MHSLALKTIRELAEGMDPVLYIKRIGLDPFPWQREALDPAVRRLLILSCRQAGKSTIIGGKTVHKARYRNDSLNLVVCPSQDQSVEMMKKVKQFLALDKSLPKLEGDASTLVALENRSRIIALPGTERSVRGYSGPQTIIIDEASRVLDSTYFAVRPMMTGADTELICTTTPFGKRGFFHHEWEYGEGWKKILVRVSWDIRDGGLVPAMPEDEFTQYWAEKGVMAFYSPRHTRDFLQEELRTLGEWWFRQEYCCEFLETVDSMFLRDEVLDAIVDVPVLYGERDWIDDGVEALKVL